MPSKRRFRSQLGKQDQPTLDDLHYLSASKVGTELLFDIIGAVYQQTRFAERPR